MADIDKEDFEQFQELPNNLKKAAAAAADLKRVLVDASDMANVLAESFGKVARSMQIGSSEMKKSLQMGEDILRTVNERNKAELISSAQLGMSIKKLTEIRDIKSDMFNTEKVAISEIYTAYSKQVALSASDLANRQNIANISKQLSADEAATATTIYQRNAAINLQLQQRFGLVKDESAIMSQNIKILSEQFGVQEKLNRSLNDSVTSIKAITFGEQIKSQATLLYQANEITNAYKNQNNFAILLNKQQSGLILSSKELETAYTNIQKKLSNTSDSANSLTINIKQSNSVFDMVAKSVDGVAQSIKSAINTTVGLNNETANVALQYNAIARESANVEKYVDQLNVATETTYKLLSKSSMAAFDMSKQFVLVKKESYGVLESIIDINSKTSVLSNSISKISTTLASKYDIPLKTSIEGISDFSKKALDVISKIPNALDIAAASSKTVKVDINDMAVAARKLQESLLYSNKELTNSTALIDGVYSKTKLIIDLEQKSNRSSALEDKKMTAEQIAILIKRQTSFNLLKEKAVDLNRQELDGINQQNSALSQLAAKVKSIFSEQKASYKAAVDQQTSSRDMLKTMISDSNAVLKITDQQIAKTKQLEATGEKQVLLLEKQKSIYMDMFDPMVKGAVALGSKTKEVFSAYSSISSVSKSIASSEKQTTEQILKRQTVYEGMFKTMTDGTSAVKAKTEEISAAYASISPIAKSIAASEKQTTEQAIKRSSVYRDMFKIMIDGTDTVRAKTAEMSEAYASTSPIAKAITAAEKQTTEQVTKRKAAYESMFKAMANGTDTVRVKTEEISAAYTSISPIAKNIALSEKQAAEQTFKRKTAYEGMFKTAVSDTNILSKTVKYIDDVFSKTKLKIKGMASDERERISILRQQQSLNKNILTTLVDGSKSFGKETKTNISSIDRLSSGVKMVVENQKEITAQVEQQKTISSGMLNPLFDTYKKISEKATALKNTTSKLAMDIMSIGSDSKARAAIEGMNESAKSMRKEYSQTNLQAEKLNKRATQTAYEISRTADVTTKVSAATEKFSDKLTSVKSNITEVSKRAASISSGIETTAKNSNTLSAVFDAVKKSSGFVSTNVLNATDKMSKLAKAVPRDGMNAVVKFSSNTLDLVSKTQQKMIQVSAESKTLGTNISDINQQSTSLLNTENDINQRLKISTSLKNNLVDQSSKLYTQQVQTNSLREQELVQLKKSNDIGKTTYLNQVNIGTAEKTTISQIIKQQTEQSNLNALKQQALDSDKKYYNNHFSMSKLLQSDEKNMSVGLVVRAKQLLDLKAKYKGVNDVAGALPDIWEKIQATLMPVAANTMPSMINVSKVLGGEFSAINELVAGISTPIGKMLQSLLSSTDATNKFELSWSNIFANLIKSKDAGKLFEQVMSLNKDKSLDVKNVFDQINDVLQKSKGGLADFFAPLEKSATPVSFFRNIAANMLKFSRTASGTSKFLAPIAGFGASLFKVFGLVAKFAGPIGMIVNAIQVAWDVGQKFISTLTEGGASIGTAILNALSFIPNAIYDALLKPFVSAIETVAELFGVKLDIVGLLKNMAAGIVNIGSKIFEPIFQAWNNITGSFTGENGLGKKIYDGISSFSQMIYGALLTPITSAWNLVTGLFSSFPEKLAETISSTAKSIASIAFEIITNPFKMAISVISGLFGASGEFKNIFIDGLKSIGSYISSFISTPFKAVMDLFGRTNPANRSIVGAGDVTKQAAPILQEAPSTTMNEIETGQLRDAIRELTAAVNGLRTAAIAPTAAAASSKLDTSKLESKLDNLTNLMMSGAIRVYLDGKEVSAAMAGIGR